MTGRREKMAETSGLEATKNEIAEAEKKVAEAEKKVAEAAKKMQKALAAFFQHDPGDIIGREILHDNNKIVLEQLRGAISHLNALQSRLDQSCRQSQFGMMVAQSPTAKHMHNAIASVDAGAVNVWSFCRNRDHRTLRRKTATHYNVYKKEGNKARCQLAGKWGNSEQVTTNHLLVYYTKLHIMTDVFEFEDVNDVRNLLLLSKDVKTAFEVGQIYFEGRNDRTFIMRILDDTVKQNPIFDGSTKTVDSLEGKNCLFPRMSSLRSSKFSVTMPRAPTRKHWKKAISPRKEIPRRNMDHLSRTTCS